MSEDWAHEAALSVVNDLSGRRGLRDEWDQIDEEIRTEIVTSWAAIIRKAYPGEPA